MFYTRASAISVVKYGDHIPGAALSHLFSFLCACKHYNLCLFGLHNYGKHVAVL